MSSPWKTTKKVEAASLRDVMTEQLVDHIETKEDREIALAMQNSLQIAQEEKSIQDSFAPADEISEDCTSDQMLARLLQAKFDDEYCQAQPQGSRGNNQPIPVCLDSEEDLGPDGDEVRDEQAEMIRNFDKAITMGGCGYATVNGQILTKHDAEMSGHRNSQKLTDNMPLSFPCGDAHTSKMPLSNKIYNELKRSAFKDQKRMKRHGEKKEKSTAESAMDEQTRLMLQKAINVSLVESYGGIIATGKEAVVIHATGGTEPPVGYFEPLPAEMAVKVFKTTLNEFKNREDYIAEDYRFKDKFKKINPRKMIRMWCEKELANLKLLNRAGIACPEPVTVKKHVLFMRFIGDNGVPAVRLKDAEINREKTKNEILEQVIDIMKNMWNKAKLVHADFSEFNLLYYQKRVYVIDVSQAVNREHPNALKFLLRDCHAITRFFSKSWSLENVPSKETIFNRVTDYNFGEPDESDQSPSDSILFEEQMEAAILELQRKHSVQRNQFSTDFNIGREDDFDPEGSELCEQDDHYQFLNHLSDLNSKIIEKTQKDETSEESDISESD